MYKVQRGGVCFKLGAKKKRCSSEGCTNLALNGGVCLRHGEKKKHSAVMDALIISSEEECALSMEQRSNDAAVKGAQTKLSVEE